MKKLILLLISAVLITSCITEKKRLKICNTCASVSSRHDSIVYKRDTVKIELPGKPGPVVFLENPCKLLCDSLNHLKNVNINTVKNGQNLHISTQGGGLNISTETKDTLAEVPVMNKETYHEQKDVEQKFIECKRDHRTDFDGFCRMFFWIIAPLLVLYGVFRWYRNKI